MTRKAMLIVLERFAIACGCRGNPRGIRLRVGPYRVNPFTNRSRGRDAWDRKTEGLVEPISG
jgi:hypothetical protein